MHPSTSAILGITLVCGLPTIVAAQNLEMGATFDMLEGQASSVTTEFEDA